MDQIFERNIDAMIIVNRDGVICFANPAAEMLLNRGRDDLVGQTIRVSCGPAMRRQRSTLSARVKEANSG